MENKHFLVAVSCMGNLVYAEGVNEHDATRTVLNDLDEYGEDGVYIENIWQIEEPTYLT